MSISTESLTHRLRVIGKKQETADTFSFTLEIPPELKSKFKYEAGQFVSFFEKINGEDVRRSYSLSSAPHDSDFTITVKRVPNGKMSNYLIDQIQDGDFLNTTPPAGLFTLQKTNLSSHFVFFAAGSGITPILSMVKHLLTQTADSNVSLLYANRDEDSIIFHREIRELIRTFSQRFRVEYVLSSPKKDYKGFTGRLTPSQIQTFLGELKTNSQSVFFMCGPEGFMQTTEATLADCGFLKSQMHRESFHTPAHAPVPSSLSTDQEDDAVYIGDRSAKKEVPETIDVQINGETHSIKYINGTTVLESAIEAQLNPPYSCMDGACMACIAKVEKGLVYQNDMGILTEDYIDQKECLTCQARPTSSSVKVSFDMM